MSDKKWKNGLLSSSLPLEYEVGRILVAKGFLVFRMKVVASLRLFT
jgi:hypothetical protein